MTYPNGLMNRRLALTSERGLTLIEIIVVLTIIAVLMGVIIPKIFSKAGTAKSMISNMAMKDVASTINQFQLQYSSLPNSLLDLTQCTEKTGQSCTPLAKAEDLVDAWKKPLIYTLQSSGRQYELKSLGEDGMPGGSGADSDLTLVGP